MLLIFRKVFLILFLGSVIWTIPMHFRLEAKKEIFLSSKGYISASFIVTRTHEVGVTRGSSYPESSYLEGRIVYKNSQNQDVELKSEFYDTQEVFKLGEISRKYKTGDQLDVLFNPDQVSRKNGQTLRVISTHTLKNTNESMSKLTLYTYGPVVVMIGLLLLRLFFKV